MAGADNFLSAEDRISWAEHAARKITRLYTGLRMGGGVLKSLSLRHRFHPRRDTCRKQALGAIIVGFHNVWHGPALVLTLVGWTQVLKGVGRFLAPQVGLRIMARATPERAWYFRIAGVLALLLSGFLWWLRFRLN